ncbi:MAG: hypothetical protein JSS79_16980 [Bacteroidetes bacterium]|nr:hypothetical protein [Bacteroidota bacterium]
MKLPRKFLNALSFLLAPFWLVIFLGISLGGFIIALIISFIRLFDW